jgi:hypothetical protein
MNQPSTVAGAHRPARDRSCADAAAGRAGAGAVPRRRVPTPGPDRGACQVTSRGAGRDVGRPYDPASVGASGEAR